jgi:hypothetical protein
VRVAFAWVDEASRLWWALRGACSVLMTEHATTEHATTTEGVYVSDFTNTARENAPTVEADTPTAETGTTAEPATESVAEQMTETMVSAVLRGGPAAGKPVLVPRIADSFPMFIGVDGGNYVRDRGAGDTAVYNWWPAGASGPTGDPTARGDAR